MKSVLVGLAALLAPTFVSAATVTSDFSTDAEGWTIVPGTGGVVTYETTGGNTGGFLKATDSAGFLMELLAPAKFNRALLDGGTISFDFNELANRHANFAQAGQVTISGGGMSATRDLIPGDPPLNTWINYSADLVAADWGKSQADWTKIIGSVTSIRVGVESGSQVSEVIGLDNFSVSVAPVPLPGGLPMAAAALAGLGLLRASRRAM